MAATRRPPFLPGDEFHRDPTSVEVRGTLAVVEQRARVVALHRAIELGGQPQPRAGRKIRLVEEQPHPRRPMDDDVAAENDLLPGSQVVAVTRVQAHGPRFDEEVIDLRGDG